MRKTKKRRPVQAGPAPVNYDLFGEEVPPPPVKTKGRPKTNPLIALYGNGPADTKCGSCVQHFFKRYAGSYPKCTIRGTVGASTDHSSRYPSCGKYEPRNPPAK